MTLRVGIIKYIQTNPMKIIFMLTKQSDFDLHVTPTMPDIS